MDGDGKVHNMTFHDVMMQMITAQDGFKTGSLAFYQTTLNLMLLPFHIVQAQGLLKSKKSSFLDTRSTPSSSGVPSLLVTSTSLITTLSLFSAAALPALYS